MLECSSDFTSNDIIFLSYLLFEGMGTAEKIQVTALWEQANSTPGQESTVAEIRNSKAETSLRYHKCGKTGLYD